MVRDWHRWLSEWLGVQLRTGAGGHDPWFTDPLTIQEFETLRSETPAGLEVMAGSTIWIDDQEHINGLIVGDRESNEVVILGRPPDADGWEELGAMAGRHAREKLAEAIAEWEGESYRR